MIISPIIPIWLIIFIFPLYWVIRSKNKVAFVRHFIILLLMFLINLRIMTPKNETSIMTNNLDVLLVFDTTVSMLAADSEKDMPRLNKAKDDSIKIFDYFDGARYSIITFDNKSRILVPFTYDKKMAISSIKALNSINNFNAYGSSLNLPYDDIYSQIQKSNKEKRKNAIFIFSDGEITNGESLKSYKELADLIDMGSVLGYGTISGGEMFVEDYFTGEKEYVEDTTVFPYERAISRIDENNLTKLATDLNISYINMNTSNNDIDNRLEQMKKSISYDINEVNTISYEDIYYIFVIPLLGLIVYEFIAFKKEFK